MDPSIGDKQTADVHIRDGVIVEIGEDLDAGDAEVIDASAMIVMPGFVDAHRHVWEGVIRNALPTEDLNEYFMLVNWGFGRIFSPDDAYLGTLVGALGALDAGITTIVDWSHIQTTPDHTQAVIAAHREARVRAVFCYGPPGAEDQGHQWPDGVLKLKEDEFSSDDQLVTLALAGLSPDHVDYEMAKHHVELARQANIVMTTHAGLNGLGTAGQIERFGNEGLLGPDINLVHCNTLSAAEWKMIADTGTTVTITASTEMQMGQGVPPIQPALDVGVKPSLGIDVETSLPGEMWTQMRLVYALQRMNAFETRFAGRQPPATINVSDILEYATIAGATAARLDDKIGTLTPGKQADIILLRTDMINVMPVNDLKSAVVLNMDARNVDTVMVAGRIVKRNGKLLGVDMGQLAPRLYESRDRVYEAAQRPLPSPVHRL
jgi:cytosine/adenosine deaminase-related metal-dependent hydrolase